MTKKELNGLGNLYVDVCSIAVSFAAAHRRQTKLANQTDKLANQTDALLHRYSLAIGTAKYTD